MMANKVLFINKTNPASIIPEMLSRAGYDVFESQDAEDGLRCLKSGSYNLIITVENAAVESWALCAKIRELTGAPLIVISSGATTESCVKAISAGADFFLRKPFGPMELMSRINALFQRLPTRQPESVVS
jgi:DNA-binding response OmpR family regulator